jgi:hypothetical protein
MSNNGNRQAKLDGFVMPPTMHNQGHLQVEPFSFKNLSTMCMAYALLQRTSDPGTNEV